MTKAADTVALAPPAAAARPSSFNGNSRRSPKVTAAMMYATVTAATEKQLVVSIPIRQTDSRQRHWLTDTPDVSLDAVADLVRRHPKARFVLLNGIGYPRSALGRADSDLPANYLIEISRLTARMRSEVRTLLDNVGPERVAFGTGMPLKYVDPPLVKLDVLDATRAEKERIRWRNAARWVKP